jgi:hypothetical protein
MRSLNFKVRESKINLSIDLLSLLTHSVDIWNQNLFNLICVLAGDSMTSETLSSAELIRNIQTQFEWWYTDFNLKTQYPLG